MTTSAKALAAESWFGYGRWEAPYWFLGMEPGGKEEDASYKAWLDLGGTPLIDCRAHHHWQLETQGIDNPNWTKWHRFSAPNKLQATWRPLILILLSFKSEPHDTEDVRLYQRDRWGYVTDETAVIGLNALHAPNLAVKVERKKNRQKCIETIRNRMVEHQPTFAVFYGTRYRMHYEEIVGGTFDSDGFAWSSDTACVLVPHSSRSGKTNMWWVETGRAIRTMVESRAARLSR